MNARVIACRLLHHTHHKYNKEHTLSPFAGLAFNPFDGILQVVPLHSLILEICRVLPVFVLPERLKSSSQVQILPRGRNARLSAQAIPYCWTLLYIPMHFLTHELLLFATGIWTTNIHDCIHGRWAVRIKLLCALQCRLDIM